MEDMEEREEVDAEEEAVLEAFRQMKSGNEVSALNPVRLRDFAWALRVLKGYAEEAGGTVSYEIGDPYPSMGYIRIKGKSLCFREAKPFREAADIASNVDVYACGDGSVCLDFTFHGMTKSEKRG